MNKAPQKNLFGETERETFRLYANKKNTIFCNEPEGGIVDTPIFLSEYESLLIEDKFNSHTMNTEYKYLLETGFYDTTEYQEYIEALAKGYAEKNFSEQEAENAVKVLMKYSARWERIEMNISDQFVISNGKLTNGIKYIPLNKFKLHFETLGNNFWVNTKYNYFKLELGSQKIYIVGEFE